MAITTKDVEHIGHLACIEITEQEKEIFAKQFNSILDHFRELDNINTENVEPTYHVIGLNNIYREDVVQESLPQEDVMKMVPRSDKGFVKGPRIV